MSPCFAMLLPFPQNLFFAITLSFDDFKILNHLPFDAAIIQLAHASPIFLIPPDVDNRVTHGSVISHNKGMSWIPESGQQWKRKAAKNHMSGSGPTKENAKRFVSGDAQLSLSVSLCCALTRDPPLPPSSVTPVTGLFLESHFCPSLIGMYDHSPSL